jgi:hypothetical protein
MKQIKYPSIFILGLLISLSLVSAYQIENKAVDQRPRKKKAVTVGKHVSAALWAMVLHQYKRSKFPYVKAYKLLGRKCLKTVKNSRFFSSLKKIVSRASRLLRRGKKGRKSSRGLRRLSRSFLRLVSRSLNCRVFPGRLRQSSKRLRAASSSSKSSRAVLRTANTSLTRIVKAFKKYRRSRKAKGSFKALLVQVARAIIRVAKNNGSNKKRKGGKKNKSSKPKAARKKKSAKSFFAPQPAQTPQVVQSLQVPEMSQTPQMSQMSQMSQVPQTPQQLVPQFLF